MKKYLFSALALAFVSGSFAQRTCGVMQHEEFLNQKNPKRAQERAEYNKALQTFIQNNKGLNQKGQAIVNIPLVVHMVYSSTTDSISDAQIFSQIQILNDDYTRQNADAVNTPAPFAAVASSPQVNYCWAQRDPNGNPTTGIERRKSTVTSWTTDDKVKFYSSGGLDAWDPSRYFNIWVCNLGGGLLGYGEFPTSTVSNTYGFVAGYFCFGNMGKVNPPYDKGRTATHEIGHCFNLFHIWGDESACANDDGCADTPLQGPENYGCPTYPHTDACQAASPGVMFMNYMDYTDDACMNTFTADQSAIMVAVVNNPPYNSLATSNACTPVTLVPLDAGIFAVNAPTGALGCTPTFTPNVTLKNWGTTTLTSAVIQYKVDAGTVQSYTWTGSLASLATATVALPAVTSTAGTHTFSANTSSPNAGTDGNLTNDLAQSNFNISATTGMAIPYTEGFEASTNIPTGWNLVNPDADAAWQINTTVAKTGTHCMGFNNCDGDGSTDMTGRLDKVITTGYDFSAVNTASMTFDVAYAVLTYSGTPYNDKLEIKASTDCGSTWTSVYSKTGATLASAPTYTSIAACWTPTATQWRNDVVNLNAYVGQPNVMLSFENTSDWGTWVYIDNINISGTIGIKTEMASLGVAIYPNPSADGKFKVEVKKNQNDLTKLNVYDILGNKVYEMSQKPIGSFEIDLSHLSNGTYFVEMMKEGKNVFTKIVISK